MPEPSFLKICVVEPATEGIVYVSPLNDAVVPDTVNPVNVGLLLVPIPKLVLAVLSASVIKFVPSPTIKLLLVFAKAAMSVRFALVAILATN